MVTFLIQISAGMIILVPLLEVKKTPTLFSITNGCDEGQLKSMHVQQFFLKNGFSVTGDLTRADLVVFFACGLTEPKEKQSILMIKKLQ